MSGEAIAGIVGAALAGIGGLVAVILKNVFSHVQKLNETHRDEMKDQREEFTGFLSNHMSANTRALERVADKLENVEDAVRRPR